MHYSLRHALKRFYVEAKYFSPVPRRAQYFVIVSQERTGSTLLSTLLSFHPRILTDMDIFYTAETWPLSRRPGRSLFSRRPVRGFKFKGAHAPLQNSASEACDFLRDQHKAGLSIVRLQRRDLLRQAISSYMVGFRHGLHDWKDRDEGETEASRVEVDVDEVYDRMTYFARLTRFQDRMLEAIPHLSLHYEDDLLDADQHQTTADRVFEHLELTPHPVETQLRKQTPHELEKVVANVEELADRLQETPFSTYMGPTPVPDRRSRIP